MSPSGVRREGAGRLSAGGSGKSPRADASGLCANDALHLPDCRTGRADSGLQQTTIYSRSSLGRAGFASRVFDKNVMYPHTELLKCEACEVGTNIRGAGREGRNDAECRH